MSAAITYNVTSNGKPTVSRTLEQIETMLHIVFSADSVSLLIGTLVTNKSIKIMVRGTPITIELAE